MINTPSRVLETMQKAGRIAHTGVGESSGGEQNGREDEEYLSVMLLIRDPPSRFASVDGRSPDSEPFRPKLHGLLQWHYGFAVSITVAGELSAFHPFPVSHFAKHRRAHLYPSPRPMQNRFFESTPQDPELKGSGSLRV